MNALLKCFFAVGLLAGGFVLQGCKVTGRVVIGAPRYDYPSQRWCGYDRWGFRHCDSYWGGYNLASTDNNSELKANSEDKYVTEDQRVAQVSTRYNISHYSAAYVVNAVVRAEAGDMSGLTLVGLNEKDAEIVYEGGRLQTSTLNRVGENLRMTNKNTEILLGKLAQVIRQAQ